MFNNINDNNLLKFNNTNNVINITNARANFQRSGYNTNPYVDKTEISANAMQLFQRDLDIKKFAKIASENPEDLSYMERIQELFSDGVIDPFEENSVSSVISSAKFWDDLNS